MNKSFTRSLVFALCCFSLSSGQVLAETTTPRLISADAFVTELLFSLDADRYLVAVDVTSVLPKNYRPVANIGYHRTLSAEGILNLNPTQVIGSEFMGPPAVISALHQADVDLIQLPSALTPKQLKNNITILAKTVFREEKATHLLEKIDIQLNSIQQQALTGKRIAFLLSMDPSKLRLAGSGTSGGALINLIDGSNVATFNNYQNVSTESILALKPDIIIVAGRTQSNAVKEILAANPVLKFTPAGQTSQIIAIDGSALIAGLSPAAIDEALVLVKAINQSNASNNPISLNKASSLDSTSFVQSSPLSSLLY